MSDPINWTQQRKRLGDLTPWPRNPRQIKSPQAKRLLQSVQEFGQVETLAIGPDGDIYNGHQRLAVLMERYGADYEVDVRVSSRPLSEKEREKLTVFLHKGAAGEWDFDTLANEFEVSELIEWGFDAAELGIDLTGGTDDDAEPQIDRAEELREQWGVESGQLWRLPSRTPGQEHRIYCGDSTKREEVARLIGSTRASLMVTDPPYGVAYHSNKKGKKSASIEGDLTQAAIPLSFAVAVENILDDDARLYLFGGTANWPMYSSLFDHYLRMQPRPMIWVKETFVLHPTHYHSQYETVFFGWKGSGGGSDYWYGDRKGSDVWMVSRDANKDRVHPTQKPVEVVEIPIRNSAPLGGIVYEPFSGSGTTIIAAENLSRQCRAVEISPGYVAVALERYATAFGIEPELVTG